MKILLVILRDHVPRKAISAAIEAVDKGGEVTLFRIIPTVLSEAFAQIEENGRSIRGVKREKSRALLAESVIYGRNLVPAQRLVYFSSIIREGVPIDIISDFTDSTKPDMILISETDSQRLGSFASGDLATAIRKRTGLPLRVVGGD